jgi:hypothetical protein
MNVEAEVMYVRVLQGYEKVHGFEHTSTLDTVNNLGNLWLTRVRWWRRRRCICGRCEDTRRQLERTTRERKRLPATYKNYTRINDFVADQGREMCVVGKHLGIPGQARSSRPSKDDIS